MVCHRGQQRWISHNWSVGRLWPWCHFMLCCWNFSGESIATRCQYHRHFSSSFFVKQLFCAPFLCLQFVLAIFWQKDICAKAVFKVLVKLTTGRPFPAGSRPPPPPSPSREIEFRPEGQFQSEGQSRPGNGFRPGIVYKSCLWFIISPIGKYTNLSCA